MQFWTGKRVTVTGGAGFLGSFVVEKLRQRGCRDVFIPRRRDYDLVAIESVKRLYRDAQPDIVVHLAAQVGGIGANRVNPGKFFYDNLMMGTQLIEQGRLFDIEKFVAVGTACCYPKFTPIPFKEEDLWAGYPEETNAPYGLAKKMLLVQSQSYRQQYGFNSIFLIPINLYGPRDNFEAETSHVIPAIIHKSMQAKTVGKREIVCWGDGTPTREFLYVEDCAEAILLAAERYDKPDPVNIGTGEEISIDELVRLMSELTGFKGDVIWDTAKPNGQPRRCLDTSKARELFGFVARTNLRDGLQRTIDWYVSTASPDSKTQKSIQNRSPVTFRFVR